MTNTNWQSYYGEQTMRHVVRTAGLAVHHFVSAAVGIAVALVRGSARSRAGDLGNFRADLVRGTFRIHRHGLTAARVRKPVDEHTEGRTLGTSASPA